METDGEAGGRVSSDVRVSEDEATETCCADPCGCWRPPIYAAPKCTLGPIISAPSDHTTVNFQPEKKRVVVAFCGSGTGHLTQCLAVVESLRKQGYTLAGVVLDEDATKKMVDEMIRPLGVPLLTLPAVKLVHPEKGVLPIPLVLVSLLKTLSKSKEMRKKICDFFAEVRPSFVCNFWHIILAYVVQGLALPAGCKMVNVAPQFALSLLPLDGMGFMEVVGKGTIDVMADIFRRTGPCYSISPRDIPNSLPPILELPAPVVSFSPRLIICYFLVKRDAARLEQLLSKYSISGVEFHCFSATPLEKPKNRPLALHSHQKQRKLFQELFARCTGVIVSTGNETIWEAVSRGVPVLTMPTPGQAEQMMNARIHSANFPNLVKAVDKISIDDVRWLAEFEPSPEAVAESERLRARVESFDGPGMDTLFG